VAGRVTDPEEVGTDLEAWDIIAISGWTESRLELRLPSRCTFTRREETKLNKNRIGDITKNEKTL
jgi:hypothetical protein